MTAPETEDMMYPGSVFLNVFCLSSQNH